MAQNASYGYPNGHQNHLSEEQAIALGEFKTLAQGQQCYTPPTDTSPASHDDETLLRFLRARKFVPADALKQFEATAKWRKEEDLETWYKTIDVDEYESTRLLYTHWTGRRDKRGIPLYVFRIGDLDARKISEAETHAGRTSLTKGNLSPKLRRLFATYEHLTTFVFPLCSQIESGRAYPETPISQTCNIVDISGVNLRQFWSLKSHLQDASVLATAHYPETLGRTFIVGAPAFFPTVWSYLKYWFDPITVAKIFVLSPSQVRDTLAEYIETSDIPTQYGGSLDWKFGDDPSLDPAIVEAMQMQDHRKTIPKGPLRWRMSEDGTMLDAYAVGTVGEKQRDEPFAHVRIRTQDGSKLCR